MMVHGMARELAENTPAFEAQLMATSTFGPEDDPVAVYLISSGRDGSDDLAMVHDRICHPVITDRSPENYSPWVPHISIAYGLDPSALELKNDTITIDRLRVSFADETVDYPLTGGAVTAANDQHDERGRFGTKSGGASSSDEPSSVKVEPLPKDELKARARAYVDAQREELAERGVTSEQVRSLADAKVAEAQDADGRVTPVLQDLAAQHGAEMAGLDHRVKDSESAERKLVGDIALKDTLAPEQVAAEMADGLRYTMTASPEAIVSVQRGVLDSLEGNGFEIVKAKNSWLDSESPYRGLNSQLIDPAGQIFELQFHTPESFEVKTSTNHPYYEEARITEDEARYNDLTRQMTMNNESLVVPTDIENARVV